MHGDSRWLLPDGVDEIVPPFAAEVERLRRRVIDTMTGWGYRLCMPPLVEFLDSLLSGLGEDLELQTFKLIDQLSGRLMGIPADMTPQVARIDAHRLPTELPQRLCYIGPVLHTRPDKFAGSRNPLQVGAELYGHAGIESDVEVICLLLETLASAGIDDVTLELGHMAVFKGLADAAQLDAAGRARVLDALLLKSPDELDAACREAGIARAAAGWLRALLAHNGGPEILAAAAHSLAAAPAEVRAALAEFEALIALLRRRCPRLDVHVDLAELRGYHYHTGVMFAAYTPRVGRAIARGGRYDDIGRQFGGVQSGRPRPATGFSTDLKLLAALATGVPAAAAIFAPAGSEPDLLAAIAAARAAGETVIQCLPGQVGGGRELGCTRELRRVGDAWQVVDLAAAAPATPG
ncbi:MAG TPA: ATP phosphoribosyltransferase regulatory subunit [Gammaproteobacteria bacterium]|nr:ATP phosphoribosyltransferase regulatory subunit [Gammaproteobacteria bacterium]